MQIPSLRISSKPLELFSVSKELENTVDLSIFSPPYFEEDGWSESLMVSLGTTLNKLMKPQARAFMVFGQIKEGFNRPHLSAELISKQGLTYWQTIIWVKSIAIDNVTHGHFQPINSKQIVNYTFEYIFQFIKDDKIAKAPQPLNRLSIGVPYTDKANLTRDTRGKNGDLHCSGDTWFVPYETTGNTNKKSHRHSYPIELVTRIIKLSNIPANSLIFDPFIGGGTTALAALKSNMNMLANDISQNAVDLTKRLWVDNGGSQPITLD